MAGDLNYEDMTYEKILADALDRVPGELDKREGSVIYNALAPACYVIAQNYAEMQMVVDESFGDTASFYYLRLRARERGVYPMMATKSVVRAEITPLNLDISQLRFNIGSLNFIATEQVENGWLCECENEGTCGNLDEGVLLPIDDIEGLESANIAELITPARDDEDVEHFRRRYFDSFETSDFGGNVIDYKIKTKNIVGVGGVKVYPTWNGGGTVKLVIINSDFAKPSAKLIDDVQNQIDPTLSQGKGIGVAPIGHVVTVGGVVENVIGISTDIVYQEGYNFELIKFQIESAVDNYFKELSKSWESTTLVVRISQIETRLLDIEGIVDISNTKLNNLAQNIVLGDNEIPKRGVLNA
ncbi:MAG: baseplate J/gp47 family protein [Anaerovoracaceae bacterium]